MPSLPAGILTASLSSVVYQIGVTKCHPSPSTWRIGPFWPGSARSWPGGRSVPDFDRTTSIFSGGT